MNRNWSMVDLGEVFFIPPKNCGVSSVVVLKFICEN